MKMREIKFRMWNVVKENPSASKMFYGADNVMNCLMQQMNFDTAFKSGIRYDHVGDGCVFMQFTGLHDKKGKEIYEGDTLRFHYFYGSVGASLGFVESEHELTGTIAWGMFGWGLNAISGEHWQGYTGYDAGEGNSNFMDLMAMNESSVHEESFEIIGNIYENPELLK